MGIERITLNFDTGDRNSMVLCSILKEIKRGHRMAVIADNILAELEEHNLLEKYADNPAAMARALVMFSENYRGTKNSAFSDRDDTLSATHAKRSKINRTKDEAKKSIGEGQAENISNSTGTPTTDKVIKELPHKQAAINDKQYLPHDQWIRAMNNEALAYFRSNIPKEQFAPYEEALRMLGDDDDRYEELVISPGLILSRLAPMPSEDMTFEEWITEQLHNKRIYKE